MRPLQDALQYRFRDPSLLRLALTHPSTKETADNQRLEFLGDSVLGFAVSDLLYRKYADRQEGELTARKATLVCEETLCHLARTLRLGTALRMGHGEEATAGREKPSSFGPLIMPARARNATINGISKATPIQKTMRVTKLI